MSQLNYYIVTHQHTDIDSKVKMNIQRYKLFGFNTIKVAPERTDKANSLLPRARALHFVLSLGHGFGLHLHRIFNLRPRRRRRRLFGQVEGLLRICYFHLQLQ